jgi:hypothetical protein
MFRSYDHLQAEIYTLEINSVVVWCWCVLGERISGYCFVSQYCVVVVVCLMFTGLMFNVCGWLFMLFVVVYYGVEDRVVNVCVYVIKV